MNKFIALLLTATTQAVALPIYAEETSIAKCIIKEKETICYDEDGNVVYQLWTK